MVFEVGGNVIWVYGVGDVGRDEEAVGVGLGEDVGWGLRCGGGEGFGDAGYCAGEKVTVGALPEEGADFFVVEEGD